MSRSDRCRGFTLLELLVSMVAVATMMVGIIKFFLLQTRTHAQQEQSVAMEENLRLGSSILTDSLRAARYSAPSNPTAWVNWVSGITSNVKLTVGGSSTTPDTLSVVACLQKPVGVLSTPASAAVDAVLSITPAGTLTDDLDSTSKSLVRIGESEFARVVSASSGSITIDTDLATSGNQPVQFNHAAGAEICRVDVTTFSVGTDGSTGVPRLLRNDNQGLGAQSVAEGISNLKIVLTPPKLYRVTLTARSELRDPTINGFMTRVLATDVTLRN